MWFELCSLVPSLVTFSMIQVRHAGNLCVCSLGAGSYPWCVWCLQETVGGYTGRVFCTHCVSRNLILYCYGQKSCGGNIQSVIGYTSLGVAFLTFIGILTYHLHMQVKGTALGKRLQLDEKYSCCTKVDLLIDIILFLFHVRICSSGAGAGPADPAAAGPIIHKTNYFKNLC